jgi:TRAP-type C4-dicarboxylate transport system substrate-binding protein
MYFGAIASNKDFYDGLPGPVQEAFMAAAAVTSTAQSEWVSELAEKAMTEMQAPILTVHELAAEEKAKWTERLPDIVAPWLEQMGDDGKIVLSAYFDAPR